MLPIEKLTAIKTIVAHENCADGLASAMIIKDVVPEAKVVFCQYGSPSTQTLKAEEGMIFCDFSPPLERAQEFVAAGTIVLDHHKTAQPVVALFGDLGVFADEKEEPGVSGAVLAYREVWLPLYTGSATHFLRISNLARLAGIRDTWQTQDPEWGLAREQLEALFFYSPKMWLEAKPNDPSSAWEDRMLLGKLLVEKAQAQVAKALGGAYRFTFNGLTAVLFQGIQYTSDAAEVAGVDLVIGFNYFVEQPEDMEGWPESAKGPKLVVSCRSRGFDVSAFAKSLGGGGHKQAAGFAVNLKSTDANPYTFIEGLVKGYKF